MTELTTSACAIRINTDHTVQELMVQAAARISAGICVGVLDQQVQLTGIVSSWHEKQLAQESLRSVSSDYQIRNELNVGVWN